MSTNFYIRKINQEACTSCGRGPDFEEIHIGKRTGGWQFSFNSFISNAKSWKEFIKGHGDYIYDEYDHKVLLEEMLDVIEGQGLNGKTVTPEQYNGDWEKHEYFDEEGYRFIKSRSFC
jgi:hypothetical protein